MKLKMQSKATILLLAATFMGLIACEELNELNTISFPYEVSKTFTVPAETPSGTKATIFDQQVKSNINDKYDLNNITADQVQSIKINGLNFVILDPKDHTFDFIEEVGIYIKADTLPELELAHQNNFDSTNGDTLKLETPEENLADYIQQDHYNLRIDAKTNKDLNQDLQVEGNLNFSVTAQTNSNN